MIRFELPANGIFSFEECLWFLDRNFDECLHRIYPGRIRKAIALEQGPVLVEVTGSTAGVTVSLLDGPCDNATRHSLSLRLREWLDLDTELDPFYNLLRTHPRLSYMPAAFRGLRSIGIPDLFEALVWSIIGQQINLKFAYTLKRRLVTRFGSAVTYENEPHYLFPTPEALLTATASELREMQFSGKKTEYILQLSEAFADGRLSKSLLLGLDGPEARQKYLTAFRGVGRWTANYTLMKSLKDRSAVPYGDAGLYNALLNHGLVSDRQESEALNALFRAFGGWETYLVCYLWRSLARRPGAVQPDQPAAS